jgi:hypothetical protein
MHRPVLVLLSKQEDCIARSGLPIDWDGSQKRQYTHTGSLQAFHAPEAQNI